MNTSSTLEKIHDWLALPKPEYCDKHGHKITGWCETADHVEHGICARCGQEVYKPEPRDRMSRH